MYAPSLICLFGAVFVGLVLANNLPEAEPNTPGFGLVIKAAAALVALYSLLTLFGVAVRRATTEIVVTDRRVLFKTGIVGRRTAEMNISKIETVDVLQGVWGRMLGFGTVLVRGTGAGLEPLKRVAAPVALRNAIVAG
jgi:uncharacterized membrane protein YdbT with pleckstrin-like domain